MDKVSSVASMVRNMSMDYAPSMHESKSTESIQEEQIYTEVKIPDRVEKMVVGLKPILSESNYTHHGAECTTITKSTDELSDIMTVQNMVKSHFDLHRRSFVP